MDEQQLDEEPVGNPPAYSEVDKYDTSTAVVHRGDGQSQMNQLAKQTQYSWADPPPPPSSHCPPPGHGHSSHYPSVPGPAGYVPACGQSIYYQQQTGYGPAYYGQPGQQQVVLVDGAGQQQQAVIIGHVQSFAGHIVLACVVTICCNCLVGLIALIIAGILITRSKPIGNVRE